ncbi:MAG: hypothetical protein ACD_15C00026G0019 [uncultured bacterium]|nr:MAG: hypothetical protein ACD_15C00026G0019 [uncultured bacterium]
MQLFPNQACLNPFLVRGLFFHAYSSKTYYKPASGSPSSFQLGAFHASLHRGDGDPFFQLSARRSSQKRQKTYLIAPYYFRQRLIFFILIISRKNGKHIKIKCFLIIQKTKKNLFQTLFIFMFLKNSTIPLLQVQPLPHSSVLLVWKILLLSILTHVPDIVLPRIFWHGPGRFLR